jgi:DNA-binding IclR family transcriptional regulator
MLDPSASTTAEGRPDMVGKALRVLKSIGDGPLDGVTLTEVARATGYPLSTAHRLAGTLAREGFVELDEANKRYRVGLAVFALAQRVSAGRGFDQVALPVLRRLAIHAQESVLMSVLDHEGQLYVAQVQGPLQLNVIGDPGTRGPIHCTSMGKALIAFAPDPVRERLVAGLALSPLGPNTITDRATFAAEIAKVRVLGYAVSDEEHEEGIRAVGVPVQGADGNLIAAISIAAPAFRRSMTDLVEMVPAMKDAAHELALTLPGR